MHSKINQRIVITGANGFVGSYLVKHLHNMGFSVTALTHSTPTHKIENVVYGHFDLKDGIVDESLIQSGDIVIHCAYNKLAGPDNDINTTGLQAFVSFCNNQKIEKHIFFSSISAKKNTSSYYGSHKYHSLQFFNQHDAILTTGLIVGNGGVFKNTLSFIQKTGLIPTIHKGHQPIYFVGIHEVLELVTKIITDHLSGHFLVANRTPIHYLEFYKSAAKNIHIKARGLNIPLPIMQLAVYLNSFLTHPFITKENLKGLLELGPIENIDELQTNTIAYKDLLTVLKSTT